jgi:hypothetical protein
MPSQANKHIWPRRSIGATGLRCTIACRLRIVPIVNDERDRPGGSGNIAPAKAGELIDHQHQMMAFIAALN